MKRHPASTERIRSTVIGLYACTVIDSCSLTVSVTQPYSPLPIAFIGPPPHGAPIDLGGRHAKGASDGIA